VNATAGRFAFEPNAPLPTRRSRRR
jgi:hypothetical protein